MRDNLFEDMDLSDTPIAHLQAALLVDGSDRTLYATECPTSHALHTDRVIGQDWRELFGEFEQVEIESDSSSRTFFFISTGKQRATYRVRKWSAGPLNGSDEGFFVLVEGVGDPAAVNELIYQERMVTLGQIAHDMAHEINNPLTTVSGWLQILLGELDESDAHRPRLQLMNEEVGRITRIVHHLLNFGRRTPVERQLVRVNRLLSDTLAMVEYQMKNENIHVAIDLGTGLPLVTGDPNQLKQVFLNIIVNARQAMPEGGTLTARTSAGEDGSTQILLGDTGHGMTDDVAERIFSPFFTTKNDEGGSGVGLFLCQNIIKDHDGSLTVATRPGEGSTFVITLPGAQEQEQVLPGTPLEFVSGADSSPGRYHDVTAQSAGAE